MKTKLSPWMFIILTLLVVSATACAALPATELTTEPVSTVPPAEPTATPTASEAIPPVAQLAIEALAAQTGIPAESIIVQSIEEVDWPNGCLGIDYKDTACTDAIVPGFRIILQANGQSYEYRSNQDGSLLMPAAPITAMPDNKITQIARAALAQQLGVSEDVIAVISQEEVDWPDGCLGINVTDTACLAVITPGFRIVLQANGQNYEYHSNKDGSQMLLATSVPATGEIPALILSVKGGIAGFCDDVSLFLSGLATFRSCNFAQETRYQLTPAQLQTLQTLASEYGTFDYTQSDPAVADQMIVQIIFNGQGKSQPTPEIYQQLQTLGMEVMNSARGISPEASSAQYLPLAGLIYTTESGLWQIGPDGAPKQLSTTQDARLSPDGQQLLTWDGNDLFLTTLASGEIRNLTNTPNRIEYPPQTGGFFADKIFFTSFPDTAEGAPGFTGYLTMINPDGSGYTVLDEENNAGLYAVSPDEHTTAYGGGQTTWLYHLDTGIHEAFTPADFGVTGITFLSSPSWSPTGEMLAWIVSGDFGGQDFALGVFDLKARAGAIFHPHQLSGLGGFPPGGVWSPDGSYIALNTFDMENGQPDAWVVPVTPLFNKRPEIHVGGNNPIWSLDGKHLVVINTKDGKLLFVDTSTWAPTSLQLPENIFNLLDW